MSSPVTYYTSCLPPSLTIRVVFSCHFRSCLLLSSTRGVVLSLSLSTVSTKGITLRLKINPFLRFSGSYIQLLISFTFHHAWPRIVQNTAKLLGSQCGTVVASDAYCSFFTQQEYLFHSLFYDIPSELDTSLYRLVSNSDSCLYTYIGLYRCIEKNSSLSF